MLSIVPEREGIVDRMVSPGRQHVAVAVVRNDRNEYLLSLRHPESHQGGLWEFPGGKVEPGETVKQAIVRELQEELDIIVTDLRPLIKISHDYLEQSVLLDVWLVTSYEGTPIGAEGQTIKWVSSEEISGYEMPAANYPIISACNLPDKYLITPDPGTSKEKWKGFLQTLNENINNGIRLVQFRAKSLNCDQYKELADAVIVICHAGGCKVLLNSCYESGLQSHADGIHLSSSQLMKIETRFLSEDKLVSASCHNLDELIHANKIGCNFIVLGPVNKTTSHPESIPMGWEMFSTLCRESRIPVYALGGVTPEHLRVSWENGAQGVSGISAFWSNSRA